jgi:hypothetical protein
MAAAIGNLLDTGELKPTLKLMLGLDASPSQKARPSAAWLIQLLSIVAYTEALCQT